MSKTKAITIKTNFELTNQNQMVQLSGLLKKHIKENNLSVNIQGKDYSMIEGWQYAGGLMGLLPRPVSCKKMEGEGIKYMTEVHIINIKNDKIVGAGFGMCDINEKKGGKQVRTDEYAVLSMSQTRAIGKAYRNLIGWVMKMSGLETTPAEEMPTDKEKVNVMFETASKMILACKKVGVLIEMDEKIQSSKKYNAEQKRDLKSLISAKIDKINV